MTGAELLVESFSRVQELTHDVLRGLEPAGLLWRPDDAANPIGWLIWHLTRVEDDHIAGAADIAQVWTAQGFSDRFDLPYDVRAHGYGQTSDEVGAFTVGSADELVSYHDAVHEQTIRFVASLTDDDVDRVVDERWDPPVTLGVRLVSVINDATQHLGQAAYVRGLLKRSG